MREEVFHQEIILTYISEDDWKPIAEPWQVNKMTERKLLHKQQRSLIKRKERRIKKDIAKSRALKRGT